MLVPAHAPDLNSIFGGKGVTCIRHLHVYIIIATYTNSIVLCHVLKYYCTNINSIAIYSSMFVVPTVVCKKKNSATNSAQLSANFKCSSLIDHTLFPTLDNLQCYQTPFSSGSKIYQNGVWGMNNYIVCYMCRVATTVNPPSPFNSLTDIPSYLSKP